MKRKYTGTIPAISLMFVFCFVLGVQAQENAAEDPIQTQDPIRLFITGNIHDKTAAVQQVSQTPESADTLSLMAIDYVLDYVPTLGADSDFLQLAQAAVAALGTPPAEQTVPRLNTLFRIFSDDTLRTAVLEKLSYYTQTKPAQTAGSVAIVNAFLTESLKPNATVGEAHLAAIRLLETAKSQSSFSVLFSYVLRGPNAQLSSAARDALNVLLPDGMQNIVRILTVNPSSEKLEIFNLVCKLAKEYEIKQVRTQFEKPYIIPDIYKHLTLKYPINLIKVCLLDFFTAINKSTVRKWGLKTNNYLIGVAYTSMMDSLTVAYGLKAVKAHNITAEALIHPCRYEDGKIDNHFTEFLITKNQKLKERIEQLGYEITNYVEKDS